MSYPHQNLPPNWQDWADEQTPDEHPIPDWIAHLLIIALGLLIPAIIVVAAWHWLVT